MYKTRSKQKGDEYEELVAQHYAKQGYIVIRNGFIAQKDDKGVDLIAIKLEGIEMEGSRHLKAESIRLHHTRILIQCKCFESKSQKSLIVDTKKQPIEISKPNIALRKSLIKWILLLKITTLSPLFH